MNIELCLTFTALIYQISLLDPPCVQERVPAPVGKGLHPTAGWHWIVCKASKVSFSISPRVYTLPPSLLGAQIYYSCRIAFEIN